MTSSPRHITACIVGFHNAAEIARCIEALGRSTYSAFDVAICENGGKESHARLVAALPQQLLGGQRVECLLAPANLGYAGGVNACIRARPDSGGWWVVNPDTQPEPGCLAALVERLDRGDCHAVGGVLYHPDGKVQAYGGLWRAWLGRPVSIGMGARVEDGVDAAAVEGQMSYILGASMLVDRTYVEAVGLMREDYFLYCEEVEWALRGIARGYRPGFAPMSRALHAQGGTTGSASPIHSRPRLPIYMDERNKLHVVRDTTPMRWPCAAVATLLLLTIRYAARGAWPQWRYALAGWFAGMRNRRGLPPWLA